MTFQSITSPIRPSQVSRFFLLLSIAIVCMFPVTTMAAGGKIIHDFDSLPNGYQPNGNLVSDTKGNFYGVVWVGGSIGTGGVYEVSPNSHGGWTQKMIYNFGFTGAANPVGSLIIDSAGNLYGLGGSGYGSVFELSPQSNGQWSESAIFTLQGKNGDFPVGGLVMDSSGNLYGVTEDGGPQSCGVAYKLSPGAKGWTQTLVYAFQCSTNLWSPDGALILDAKGNLYGTTSQGGSGYGTVYELSPSTSGWSVQVLYAFSGGSDGYGPKGSLVFDKAGNLDGATVWGGSGTNCGSVGCGVIFELAPASNGAWTESVVHSFNGTDGSDPVGNLAIDGSGNLYGTTEFGGSSNEGVAFEVSPERTDGARARCGILPEV
jgi:uncharacterized repeat protein (TIGR03803 family)